VRGLAGLDSWDEGVTGAGICLEKATETRGARASRDLVKEIILKLFESGEGVEDGERLRKRSK